MSDPGIRFPDGSNCQCCWALQDPSSRDHPRYVWNQTPRALLGGNEGAPDSGSPGLGASGVNLMKFGILQLPTGKDGNPDTVTGARLASYENSNLFERNGRAITFKVPEGGGATTANSKYPRTELAEAQTWRMSDGKSRLSANLSVDDLPPNGTIVVAQIHQRGADGEKQRPPVEIVYRDGALYASVLDSNSPNAKRVEYKIADGVKLGEAFSLSMELGPDGTLDIQAAGRSISLKLDPSFADSNLYFKAGNYTQDPAGGSAVTFYGLDIQHQRAPEF